MGIRLACATLLLLAYVAVAPGIAVEPTEDPLVQDVLRPLAVPDAPPPPELPEPIEPLVAVPDVPDAAPPLPGGPPLPWSADAAAEVAPPVLAAGGVLAVAHALGALRWLAVAGVGLYSRLARSDLLGHATRDRVHKLVQERPGIGLTELAQEVGLGWGTAVYHLDRLEKGGFVSSERIGAHRCYFPVGAIPRESRKGIGALKQDTTRTIAQLVADRPGVTQTEVCEALGMSASAASKQVSKLESAGLVRRERDWKTVRLHPQPGLRALV